MPFVLSGKKIVYFGIFGPQSVTESHPIDRACFGLIKFCICVDEVLLSEILYVTTELCMEEAPPRSAAP